MCFQYREDADRMRKELTTRLQKFGLELHKEKTRLIEFGRFAEGNRKRRGEGKPKTFDFLGFTHICSKGRKSGKYIVRRKSIKKRIRAKLQSVKERLAQIRSKRLREQAKWLRSVVIGWMNYHAIPGNREALDTFRTEVIRSWMRSLRHRSQKAKRLRWEKMKKIVRRWIPSVRIVHPYPDQRLCV